MEPHLNNDDASLKKVWGFSQEDNVTFPQFTIYCILKKKEKYILSICKWALDI